MDGGVRISLANGLDLTELGVDIYLGFDDNFNLNVSLGDLKAGINSVPEDNQLTVGAYDFVNIFETPNVFLGLSLGVEAEGKGTGTGILRKQTHKAAFEFSQRRKHV